MSRGALGKNNWALFLMLLAGIMLGGFIGNAAAGVSGLSWLNYGQSFGFASPIVLDLGILVITFGLSIKITIASIIGVLIAIIIYRLFKFTRNRKSLGRGKLLPEAFCVCLMRGHKSFRGHYPAPKL